MCKKLLQGAPPVAERWGGVAWLVRVSLKGAPFSQKFCPDGLSGASPPRVPVVPHETCPEWALRLPIKARGILGVTGSGWPRNHSCPWAPPHALLPLTPPNYFSWML